MSISNADGAHSSYLHYSPEPRHHGNKDKVKWMKKEKENKRKENGSGRRRRGRAAGIKNVSRRELGGKLFPVSGSRRGEAALKTSGRTWTLSEAPGWVDGSKGFRSCRTDDRCGRLCVFHTHAHENTATVPMVSMVVDPPPPLFLPW